MIQAVADLWRDGVLARFGPALTALNGDRWWELEIVRTTDDPSAAEIAEALCARTVKVHGTINLVHVEAIRQFAAGLDAVMGSSVDPAGDWETFTAACLSSARVLEISTAEAISSTASWVLPPSDASSSRSHKPVLAPTQAAVEAPVEASVDAPVEAPIKVTAASPLLDRLVLAVDAMPGSTARELVKRINQMSLGPVSKKDLNPVLYRNRARFASDGGAPPRWRPSASAASTSRVAATAKVKRHDVAAETPAEVYAHLLSVPQARPRPVVASVRRPRDLADFILPMFDWQRRALRAWYQHGCSGIVEAVTGTGKTHVGLEAVAQAHSDGEKSVVLVPSVELQRQWRKRFAEHLPHLSVCTVGGQPRGVPERSDVTIAVINSAVRRDLSRLSPDSLLVADEVHRYGAETWAMALRLGFVRRLGLTATLERSGDDAVEDVIRPYFGRVAYTYGFRAAIDEQVVAPFRIVLAPIVLTADERAAYDKVTRQISNGFKTLRGAGALNGADAGVVQRLGALRAIPGRVGAAARAVESGMRERRQLLAGLEGKLDAVEELAGIVAESDGSLVFTETKEMAEEAAARLREWDVPAAALHSSMDDAERRQNLSGFDGRRIRALAAPRLLDEGIDVPHADLGIVMTASRSRRQMIQRLGRVIRRKADGVTVDFVVLFAADTVEDPHDGAHEGFFDMLLDVSAAPLALEPGWSASEIR